jgi:2-phosphosulfolactate phosphatase
MLQKNINICLSPDLIHLYEVKNKVVVVTDIFRATSCMVTGLANGIASFTPIATISECAHLQSLGYIAAAERDAKKVDGFELDNSPFSYMDPLLKGKNIAMTTTNGTLSISKVKKDAAQVLVGAFLNIETIANYLIEQNEDLIILCAGWKGTPSLEDSLFGGALVDLLKSNFKIADDSATMTYRLFKEAKNDLRAYLQEASHLKRLSGLGIEKDIDFCLTRELYSVLPILIEDKLVLK